MTRFSSGNFCCYEALSKRIIFSAVWIVFIFSSCAKEKYHITFDEVYHQSFDDFSFLKYEEWGQETMNPLVNPKSEKLPRLEINENAKGRYLKISVCEDDKVYMNQTKNETRSRSEVIFKPSHGDNSVYYYSWMVYIPNDSSFQDIEVSENTFHIIAQWHQSSDGTFPYTGSQPPFKLSYKHKLDAEDEYRDLAINYGIHYNNTDSELKDPLHPRKKRFLLTDAIKKGVWTKITTGFHWAADSTGYMQIWIDDNPCVLEKINGNDELRIAKSESAFNASRIYGPNLYTAKKTDPVYPGMPVPNYFKFGHYRGEIKGSHTLYIDDFTVSVNMRMAVDNM